MFWGMLIGYSLIFFLLVAVVMREAWKKKYYITAKTANSLVFVIVFFIASHSSSELHQFWLMLPAVLCCFAGDILMAEYNRHRKRVHFLMGLGIFLAGHLCFARWLCTIQMLLWVDFIIPILAVLLAWYLLSLKSIHTGRLKPFILLYAFFVAMVLSKGIGLVVINPTMANVMIAVGAVLFFVSDVSILFLYFQKRKGVSVHLFNLATYYYGMFLLTSHLLFL